MNRVLIGETGGLLQPLLAIDDVETLTGCCIGLADTASVECEDGGWLFLAVGLHSFDTGLNRAIEGDNPNHLLTFGSESQGFLGWLVEGDGMGGVGSGAA